MILSQNGNAGNDDKQQYKKLELDILKVKQRNSKNPLTFKVPKKDDK